MNMPCTMAVSLRYCSVSASISTFFVNFGSIGGVASSDVGQHDRATPAPAVSLGRARILGSAA